MKLECACGVDVDEMCLRLVPAEVCVWMLMKCVRDWSQLRYVCVVLMKCVKRLVPAEVCVCADVDEMC